ncbi:hypothetical protein V5799_022015 [Amblyomma americanum]|uniref:Uncharacterized protein n=1 Tax=Amblyomma americanum TaxID=6943 RepID=A0AAQ4FLR6_AMBAM
MSVNVPRKKPWRSAPTGILKAPPGVFSLPRKPPKKTLQFQVDQPQLQLPPPPDDLAQQDEQEEGVHDPVLASGPSTAEISDEAKEDKSSTSSSTSTEESSGDKPRSRSRKRRSSPPQGLQESRSSSSGEVGSVAPYWMPEEVQHYFLNYREDSDGVGRPSTKGVSSALQFIGSEQPPPDDAVAGWKGFARQPHWAFAGLCFAAVFALIFAAMSADVYESLVHEARGYL